jgi:hypothetical protein
MINTYALIKDGVVVNSVVIDEMTPELNSALQEQWNTTEIILIDPADLWTIYVGTLWDGNNFIPVQGSPFPSWVWSTLRKIWTSPVPLPEDKDTVKYTWNESVLNWVVVE